jgi:hypothetical protein
MAILLKLLDTSLLGLCNYLHKNPVKPLLTRTPIRLSWMLAKAAGAVADDTKKDTKLRTN